MKTEKPFEWSTRSEVGGKWRTFYYALGSGFDAGRRVYYGLNEWNNEQEAIKAQHEWEAFRSLQPQPSSSESPSVEALDRQANYEREQRLIDGEAY